MVRKITFMLSIATGVMLLTACPKPKEDSCGAVRVKCVNEQQQPVDGILVKGAWLSVSYGGESYYVQDTMYTGSGGRPSGCADVYACKGETVSTQSTVQYLSGSGVVTDNLSETVTIILQKR